MPRNTDPDDIKVGSGQAGEESVTSSSLTVNISPGGSVGGESAADIESIPPDHLSGDDLQENLYSIDGTAPTPYPNLIGEAKTGVPNPSSTDDWTYSEPLVDGFFYDGSTVAAKLINSTLLTISDVVVYPADRGILAVRLVDGGTSNIIQALNLKFIFSEGDDPNDTVPPSRWISQPDYTAGSNSVGTVDSLPQGISLSDRVPTLESYSTAPYEGYPYDFYAYQIATATFDINLGGGEQGELEIIHYRTEADYVADRDGTGTPETYSITPVSGGDPLFVDTDTTTVPSITSFDIDPADTTDSAETGGNRRFLSGILYYSDQDEFDFDFTATGLYADSYLGQGIVLQMPGTSAGSASDLPLPFSAYSPSPINPGSTASFSDANFTISHGYVTSSDFVLRASDPFGRDNVQAWPDAGTNVLIHSGDYGTTPDPKVELFQNETSRYRLADLISEVQIDGTGSTFDSSVALTPTDGALQVRGVAGTHTLPEGVEGGELAWPDVDYSTGHFPTTKDGATAQEDYSSLTTTTGARSYIRAFDLEKPGKQFRVRIVGNHLLGSASLWEDLFLPEVSDGYSSAGVAISFGERKAILSGGTLPATTYLSSGGSLVEVEEESEYSVVLTQQIQKAPGENSVGEFPLVMAVTIQDGSPAATAGEFALYKVEIL